MKKHVLLFEEFSATLNEGGHAISDARLLSQLELQVLYDWAKKNVLKKLKLKEGEYITIGSYLKKAGPSSDLDIAVSLAAICQANRISEEDVLDFVAKKFSNYDTHVAVGFRQVSIAVPAPNYGTAQIDLMISSDLGWSNFIYHSPDFLGNESQYKGAYRNMLLMSIISEMDKKVLKSSPTGEVEEFQQYVIRLEAGVFQVVKTYMGKRGALVKNPTLIKDQDKFVSNTPAIVVKMAFGDFAEPSMCMTFEQCWKNFNSTMFQHAKKRKEILHRFKDFLEKAHLPYPSELQTSYPELF